jgi:hypothetical protein
VWKKRNSVGSPQPELDLGLPFKIKHYEAFLIWSFQEINRSLDNVVSDGTLEILKESTGCDFIKNLNEQKIYIGHSSMEKCQVAITKLDNIRKYSASIT